jgi:hypothetical protein
MWLGSGTLANAPFRVVKEGDVTAKSLTLTGTTEISTEPTSDAKIYLGAGNYNNEDTPFYVDNTSQFSLGNKLTWDGNNLVVQGILKFPDGSTPLADEGVEDAVEEVISSGFVGGLTISSSKMFYGAGNFANQDTAFYVGKNSSTGQADFSLGDKLSWNGTNLIAKGTIEATGGKIGPYSITNEGISEESGIRNVKIHPLINSENEPLITIAYGPYVTKMSAFGFNLETGGGEEGPRC